MREFEVDIAGIQHGERWVNQQLKRWVDFRDNQLSKVTCDGYVIRFYFEPKSRQDASKRVIAKQFSKGKYSSCNAAVTAFHATTNKKRDCFTYCNWKEVCRIEQEKYWLVIFEERR